MKWRILPVLLLFFVAKAGAQTEASPLTLQDALQKTLTASQLAKKAQLEIENVGYQIEETRSRALPQLSGTGSLTYNPLLQLTALPGELAGAPGQTLLVAFGQKWNSGVNATLSQTLFDQSVFTGLKAAKSSQEYYRINAQLTEEQLIEEVANLYYQVLVQKHKISVLDSTLGNTTRVQKIISGQFENGLARKIDVDRITVSISNLQSQRQQALNAVAQYENQLKFAMGMSIQTPINLPPVDFSGIHAEDVVLADGVQLENRTEFKLLLQQKELLEFKKDSYKAEYYPTLGLTANYGYSGLGQSFPLGKGPTVNWFDYSSMGLNLKIPIFNGWATRSRVRQANVAIKKLNEDIDRTNLSLNMEFENAKSQINNSLITLRNQKENVNLAQDVYSNTQNNYNNGLAPLTDLLDAEKSLTEANNNRSSALLDYKLAEIKLLKANGNLRSLLNK